MTNITHHTYDDALAEASKWLAREEAGDMTAEAQEMLEHRLASDETFQLAYLETMRAANILKGLSNLHGEDLLSALAPDLSHMVNNTDKTAPKPTKKPRLSYGWMGAIAASFLAIAVIVTTLLQTGPMSSIYETAVGESRTIMLKDGSVITLNTDTRLSVALAANERRILLEKGEAYFDVAKDKSRPFLVVVGDETVRAVGTEFNIKHRNDITNIMVTEGIVEVKKNTPVPTLSAQSQSMPVSLAVGGTLTTDPAGVRTSNLSPEELMHQTSWRRGMLHFKSKELSAVVQEVQYYVNKEIIIASDQASSILIGGSINTQNVTSFLKGLEVNFPVSVIERSSVIIISYKSKEEDMLQSTSM
ncbi:FecR family protein [Kordiimonas pumila]|uniref:FecR family protein n=1 Tax=Kordiimonas pumila TaxID=2161677 RepID=A0ABV7D6G7_9PROT|nr:FecR domain-containing protein [Kordiimonas pumila]